MARFGFILLFFFVLAACKHKQGSSTTEEEEENGFNYDVFAAKFTNANAPYELDDTALLHNKDTALIVNKQIISSIPDSITKAIFAKGKIKYIAMAKIEVPKAESYFIVKATQGSKKAALLLTFDKDKQFGAALPFLVPDDDAQTEQAASIDKNFTISRSIVRKQPNEVNKEGKDVFVYNNDARQYTLIMTDPLDEKNTALINPIDTLPHKNKFSGDYVKDKKNMVSVRDGKRASEAVVFIHIENKEGDCTGELKGRILWIAANTAIYRQGGDPCVLELSFKPTSVTVKEQEGCGARRGLNCSFEGTYPLKKQAKPKKATKKHTGKNK